MIRLSCEVPTRDLRALLSVIPDVLRRWHAAPNPEAELTVIEDTSDLLECSIGSAAVQATVRVNTPAWPGDVHAGARVQLPPDMAVFGREGAGTASVYPGSLDRDGALGVADGRTKRVRVSGQAQSEVVSDRVRVAIKVKVSPRGLFLPFWPLMPVFNHKVQRSLQAGLDKAVDRLADLVASGDLAEKVWQEITSGK